MPPYGAGNPPHKPPPPSIPYANPLRGIKNLSPERIDMGVDYAGQGPLYAVGPGVITESDTAWAGGVGAVGPGTFITERLTKGPLAGKYVYFSENINPAVAVGQQVDTSTVIGQMTGQGAGIETGYAAGPTGGTTLAMASGQSSTSGDPGANTTAYGRAWSDVLHFLGAPAGVQGGPDTGSLPSGWWTGGGTLGPSPGPGSGAGSSAGGGGLSGLFSIPSDITGAFDTLNEILRKLMWLVDPANWARIVAGLLGFLLLAAGLVAMIKAASA